MSGPFDVDADRIRRLDSMFTPFVNQLLRTEVSAHRLRGHTLSVTREENTPDGGVDAELDGASETDYLPAGTSAWQFKRTNLTPAACEEEIAGAKFAHQLMKDGATYVLVLGVPLNAKLIAARQKTIADKAIKMKLIKASERSRVRVYDANKLADWVEQYPALALDPISGGPGGNVDSFSDFKRQPSHQRGFVEDDTRNQMIDTLRAHVSADEFIELRVEGDSGIGKTRLVMEALRDDRLASLVVYARNPGALEPALVKHFDRNGHTAIIVVDDCPADEHVKTRDKLVNEATLRLITIGPGGSVPTSRTPVLTVGPLQGDDVEAFLRHYFPTLPSETRRWIAAHGQGNMRWTIALAERVLDAPDQGEAAEIIARDDIRQFVTSFLPEGRDFFLLATLALLDRVGWDGGARQDLEALSSLVEASLPEMEAAAQTLEGRALLDRQGRYRAIAPLPLAVFLAAEGWRMHGGKIVSELLPRLDEHAAAALFRRAADLGRYEHSASHLAQLLDRSGLFGSLESIDTSNASHSLPQLAIVMPAEVCRHLSALIRDAPIDQLRDQTRSRRDLVWALEKLVWHTETFEQAADALLRLSLAENETFSNNATGTWRNLFGTFLPSTAAKSEQRAEYLATRAKSKDPQVRLGVVNAAANCFDRHETVMVSGELQGGSLVEQRGTPTYDEAASYREALVSLLEQLSEDSDPSVSTAATDALVHALHSAIDDPYGGRFLLDALTRIQGESLLKVRREVSHLQALYTADHVFSNDADGAGDRKAREEAILDSLRALSDRLPTATVREDLELAVHLNRWDVGEEFLRDRVAAGVASLADEDELSVVLDLLDTEVPAAWEIGQALADATGSDRDAIELGLVERWESNPPALVGYLGKRVENGQSDAFIEFLASPLASMLTAGSRLRVAASASDSPELHEAVFGLVEEVSVADGARGLFAWQRNVTEAEAIDLVDDWLGRLETQEDYDAVLDWLSVWLHREADISPGLEDIVLRSVEARARFRSSREGWAWSRLAEQVVSRNPLSIATLLLTLVESGDVMLFGGRHEAKLLVQAATLAPAEVWAEMAQRLDQPTGWRLELELRGWLAPAIPDAVLMRWIGNDLNRGQLVARLAAVSTERPAAIVAHLLTTFDDDQIRASLYGTLISGVWTGNESDRLARFIEELDAWRFEEDQPPEVREWARSVAESLQRQRAAALEREAEERF